MKKEICQNILYRARLYCTTEQTKPAWEIQNYTPIHKIRQTGQKEGGIVSLCLITLLLIQLQEVMSNFVMIILNIGGEYHIDGGNCKEKGQEYLFRNYF